MPVNQDTINSNTNVSQNTNDVNTHSTQKETKYSKREKNDDDFKNAFDEKEWHDYKNAKRRLELENKYMYGDRAFARIADKHSEKIVCFEAYGIDGRIEPYRVYEVGVDYNIHDEDTFNREIIETIIDMEKEGINEKLITKELAAYQHYAEKTLFRKHDGTSTGFRTLRENAWQKSASDVGVNAKPRSDRGRYAEISGKAGEKLSIRETDSQASRLLEENETLREANELLKKQMKAEFLFVNNY